LTGAAPWAYFSATQYILGLRPEVDGLRIDPCIPCAWEGFTATRRFRGKTIDIRVVNPDHVSHGIQTIALNGRPLPDNLVPVRDLIDQNRVDVVMG
jgi:N,N'-diacetylchitobiose phosphorylase